MLAQVIEKRTGIQIRAHMHIIVADIADALVGGADQLAEKLARLPESATLWQQVIAELTLGETYFLRDEALFRHLRRDVFPAWIAQNRPLRVLSIGCATGEEVYSLAIILEESGARWEQMDLIGVDLNARALEAARRGVYRAWSFRHAPPHFRERYFDMVESGWQIKPEWRERVHFRQTNLMVDALPDSCDLILCRNVFIYFSREHLPQAERRISAALGAGGRLYLGHAEILHNAAQISAVHTDNIVYYHRAAPSQAPASANPPQDEINVYAHLRVATLLADQGEGRAAHEMLNAVLEADPLVADGHYLRATLFMEHGDSDAAEKSLRAALYCQRNHPLAGYLFGNLLASRGEMRGAIRAWKTAQAAIIRLQDESLVGAVGEMSAGQLRRLLAEKLNGVSLD